MVNSLINIENFENDHGRMKEAWDQLTNGFLLCRQPFDPPAYDERLCRFLAGIGALVTHSHLSEFSVPSPLLRSILLDQLGSKAKWRNISEGVPFKGADMMGLDIPLLLRHLNSHATCG